MDYNKQAKDFLEKANAKMKIEFIGMDVNKLWNETQSRNCYRIVIKTKLGQYTFKFWDSIYNTRNNIEPTEYDILACLEKYDVGTFCDFCNEFGYSEYDEDGYLNRKNKQLYNAVKKEYESLCRIFTDEQMEMLREIQ